MQADILTASIRVLRREGPLRFTTSRVAEAAGISVGSLYQYYPNKQSLVFALHARRVDAAWVEVQRILDDASTSARAKIHAVARMFFRAEAEDVEEMGPLLAATELLIADAPDLRAMEEQVLKRFDRFVRESMPRGTSPERVEFGAQVLVSVIDSVGRLVARQRLSRRAIDRRARACADMIADFLDLA